MLQIHLTDGSVKYIFMYLIKEVLFNRRLPSIRF